MKHTLVTLLSLLLALGLLTACGKSDPISSTSSETVPESTAGDEEIEYPTDPDIAIDEPLPLEPAAYRGVISAILEDGGIEVEQLYGYDYGYERILFILDDATEIDDGGFGGLNEGAFVQVMYDGILTRSDPPQGTADHVTVIASYGDGVIVNGQIVEVSEADGGYTLTLNKYQTPMALEGEAANDDIETGEDTDTGAILPELDVVGDNTVIVHVEADALENITIDELVVGAEVSVVTHGIMAMSMPPQVSAYALLPFAP